jgi:hypothetical protein
MAEFRRNESFLYKYANNIQLELSVWDMKLVFGEFNQYAGQQAGQEVVEQHTAITVPWAQAKLLSLYLQLNLAFHEKTNGKISIPPSLIPTFPMPDEAVTDQNTRELAELYNQKVQEFLADL